MLQTNQSKSKRQSLFFRLVAIVVVMLIVLWFIKLGIKTFIISSAVQPQATDALLVEDSDQYTILSKIIEENIIRDSTELILIESETSYELLREGSEKEKLSYIEISNETWMDFLQKNQDHHTLNQSFTLSKPYTLIDSNNREKINRRLLFTNNIEHTPFLQFSEVGFSPQGDEALVHLSLFSWGDRLFNRGSFGLGEYIYLKKVDGIWKILNEWQSFIT